jgi:AICAR transformylase/IMP cyclohydrolase PurH
MMSQNKEGASARKQYFTTVKEDFPERIDFGGQPFLKRLSMRYGENPGMPSAFYIEEGASGANMATLEVLREGSKGLGYINIGDMDLGQRLVRKLTGMFPDTHICALIKHEIPSGVALGHSPEEAFGKAWACDSLSNFGSVDVFNFAVNVRLAKLLVEAGRNIEVVYAPDFAPEAMEIFSGRKPLRVVRMGANPSERAVDNGLEFKRVAGGLLVQKRFNSKIISPDSVDFVSARKPTEEEIRAALFNWTVACFTRSNAIVIGKSDKVHGIGSGQRSRIDAAEDAVRFSRRGYGPDGCVLASDAYMPFPDVVELAAANGITAIIYPLGSIRDEEVIAKADEHGMAMIVTRRPGEADCERCFLHR